MSLKINEFIINASVLEDESAIDTQETENTDTEFSDSVKKEIIDECVSRIKELLDREKSRH